MVQHEKLCLRELWCGDAASCDGDDCTCAHCKLAFHEEMAAWAREDLRASAEPAACEIQKDKHKCAKTKDG